MKMKSTMEKTLLGQRKELDIVNENEKSVQEVDSIVGEIETSNTDDDSVDNTELIVLGSESNSGDEGADTTAPVIVSQRFDH